MARKLDDHLKERGCWFTAVSHQEESRNNLKKHCVDFPFWAYIDHSPDKEDDENDKHFHTHLLIRSAGTRRIKEIAEQLEIPPNFVQVCRHRRSLMRYFIHLDNPDKIQYKLEDVHTNKVSAFELAFQDDNDDDCKRLFSDLNRLRYGEITLDDFVSQHYVEFQKMPFYQKIRTYEYIERIAGAAHLTRT